jgi:hypothetical protein
MIVLQFAGCAFFRACIKKAYGKAPPGTEVGLASGQEGLEAPIIS